MQNDVAAYMRYYNLDRLHTANGDRSPIDYEMSFRKCPEKVAQNNGYSENLNENKLFRIQQQLMGT